MTWWLWTMIGMLIASAQLATTVAVCRAAALGDQPTARAERRRLTQRDCRLD